MIHVDLKVLVFMPPFPINDLALQWRHNEHDGVSNHQPNDCSLNRLFRRSSKKTSKLRVTGLCVGNSPVTDEFPAERTSNAEKFPFDDVIMESFKEHVTEAVSSFIALYGTHIVTIVCNMTGSHSISAKVLFQISDMKSRTCDGDQIYRYIAYTIPAMSWNTVTSAKHIEVKTLCKERISLQIDVLHG